MTSQELAEEIYPKEFYDDATRIHFMTGFNKGAALSRSVLEEVRERFKRAIMDIQTYNQDFNKSHTYNEGVKDAKNAIVDIDLDDLLPV